MLSTEASPPDERRLALRKDRLEWVDAGDEVIVLDGIENHYLANNAAGSALWRALSGGATLAELADALISEFGISAPEAEADVQEFITELESLGLLESP